MTLQAFDKAAMLEKINASWAKLINIIAQFDAITLETPRSSDGWSIKDTMAHITFWEGYALRLYNEVNRGEQAKVYGDHFTEDDLNRLNAEILAKGRAKSLEVVQAEFAATHRDLIAVVEGLPDAFDAAWIALWPDESFPHNLLIWNSYEHYDEHQEDMQQWLQAK